MYAMGLVMAISGFVMVALGVIILAAAVAKLVNNASLKGGTSTTEAPVVNLPDVSKLIEALVKLPPWLLAIIAGDVQIWIATRLMSNLPWWPQ